MVERDRSIGSVSPYKIEHLLEQFEMVFVPDAAADDDALPWSGTQGSGDDRLHIVAPVKAEKTSLNAEAVLSESSYSHLDCVGYRLGIPGPGNPIWIEPDYEDSRCQVGRAHLWNTTPQEHL
ncbi:MAG TPA: hypothetical protein VKS82_25850 [Streptosporangiaceae bacterium]|nr:hypothetical protein [Streptosporangiaceae bacterium]